MMRNTLRRHQKSDKIKWILAFAAILLLAGGLTMICLQLFAPYKPSNGFKKAETESVCTIGTESAPRLAKNATITVSGHTISYIYGLGTSEYLIRSEYLSQSTYENTGWNALKNSASVYGTWNDTDGIDLTTSYGSGTLTYGTTYYLFIDMIGSHSDWKQAAQGTFTVEEPWNYVPLPQPPVKEGHTFTGWYLDEACTQKYTGETVRDDITLYAGWTVNRYTVTYDSNGGSSCDSITVDWNTPVTAPIPTREGYEFLGWFEGDNEYKGEAIKADKTLTARWNIKTFTVTFMVDGEVYKTLTVQYGTSLQTTMQSADLTAYGATDMDGRRISKVASTITADTMVLIHDQTAAEKFGEFVGRHIWTVWVTAALLGALALSLILAILVAVKRR